jgi:hypothetical protein
MSCQVVHTLALVAPLYEVCGCRFRHSTRLRLKSQVEASISDGYRAETENLIVDI